MDPALAAHHLGSKEALWQAVVQSLASPLPGWVAELIQIRAQHEVSSRERLIKGLRHLLNAIASEPELGTLISRAGTEIGERNDFLIDQLLRPYHDAFIPLLEEAVRDAVLPDVSPEVMYVLLLNAISMTFSFKQVLTKLHGKEIGQEHLKEAIMPCLLALLSSGSHV